MRRSALFLLPLVPVTSAILAQPVGPEFRVHTYTTYAQYDSSVSVDASGNFVAVWSSGSWTSGPGQDGSLVGVYGQRFAASGAPLGGEFRVNTTTTESQAAPRVASDAGGGFVVAWVSLQDSPADPSSGVYAQRFASDGSPRAGEFRVNTYTTSLQSGPWVASDAIGNFVIVWNSDQDGNGTGIFGQRFASSGAPLGGEFPINTETLGNENFPIVSSDALGSFVVVWNIDSVQFSRGQRFSGAGAPLGPEFDIPGSNPKVSMSGSGGFVVVWHAGDVFLDVFAQRYSSDGSPLGLPVMANTYTPYDQSYPAVAADQHGNFVVVWGSPLEDGSDIGVFGRRFDFTGLPVGNEFQVNTYTTSIEEFPAIASSPNGTVVVSWDSCCQDATLFSTYAQRFGFLSGDANGDGTVNVSDVLYLINHLFAGGPGAVGRADANGDGKVDVSDVLYLINYLFAGGPTPGSALREATRYITR